MIEIKEDINISYQAKKQLELALIMYARFLKKDITNDKEIDYIREQINSIVYYIECKR